jgi:hypothetical protein
MAYTEDGRDLVTIERREAKRSNLAIIPDPWLAAKESEPFAALPWDSGWGPYRCPVCFKNTLRLCPRG